MFPALHGMSASTYPAVHRHVRTGYIAASVLFLHLAHGRKARLEHATLPYGGAPFGCSLLNPATRNGLHHTAAWPAADLLLGLITAPVIEPGDDGRRFSVS